MKKFLDQDFSGAALSEFKREVSSNLTFVHITIILLICTKEIEKTLTSTKSLCYFNYWEDLGGHTS